MRQISCWIVKAKLEPLPDLQAFHSGLHRDKDNPDSYFHCYVSAVFSLQGFPRRVFRGGGTPAQDQRESSVGTRLYGRRFRPQHSVRRSGFGLRVIKVRGARYNATELPTMCNLVNHHRSIHICKPLIHLFVRLYSAAYSTHGAREGSGVQAKAKRRQSLTISAMCIGGDQGYVGNN